MSRSAEREKRQVKVFTKWVNSYLRKKQIEVDDLGTCFQDGVNLCYLYEIISEEKLPRYSTNPRGMIQKTNNLAIVLKRINSFVEECGIRLQYSPQQIASGDSRQVLGMLWILITKFVIPESEESLSRKRSLLRWVQRVTEPYDNVDVKNFTRSWKDGLAFNALLDQFDNTLMDYSALTKDDPAKNCENAFATAEKLGIYRLLDVEDITDMDVPDDKSVMTYVSTMYQYFHSQAGRKLEQDAKQLVVDIGKLLEWIRKNIGRFGIPEPWTEKEVLEEQLEDCRGLEKVLQEFNVEKAQYANLKSSMYLKLANIQRIQRNERLKVFNPPKEQNMGVLHRQWAELNDTIIKYSAALRDEIKRIEDAIRKREEEWIQLKEKNNKERREDEKKRLEDELKKRDEDENIRKTEERKRRDEWIQKCEDEAEEKRKQERQRIEDEIAARDKEEDEREHEERRVRDEDIAQKEAEANEKREQEKKMLEQEIEKREKEEAERLAEERKARDEWVQKCEDEANEARILEKKMLEDEIKKRDVEDSKRREEERRRREMIIKQQEEKAAADLQAKREQKEKEIGEMLEEEARKRKLMREKADEDSEKAREDENKKRIANREQAEKEIAEKRAAEAKRRQLLRKAKDEEIEKFQAAEFKKNAEAREKIEEEIKENIQKEAEDRAKLRTAQDEAVEKKEQEEQAKREQERNEKESSIAERLENERQARADERARVLDEKKAKEEDEKKKLAEYDSEATSFLAWISSNQSELTHTEEVGEDEEDESTDEETRNKRKQAAVEVKEKIKPALERWEVLVSSEIQEWASIPVNELQYAMDTFCFALVGEEPESLKEIRKFKFPEEEAEGTE